MHTVPAVNQPVGYIIRILSCQTDKQLRIKTPEEVIHFKQQQLVSVYLSVRHQQKGLSLFS